MSNKKKFKDTTVGKLLFGAASVVSPQLGAVLNGVTSPKDAIAEIGKAKISTDVLSNEIQNRKNNPILEYAQKSDQVIITPHIGGMTTQAQQIEFNHAANL